MCYCFLVSVFNPVDVMIGPFYAYCIRACITTTFKWIKTRQPLHKLDKNCHFILFYYSSDTIFYLSPFALFIMLCTTRLNWLSIPLTLSLPDIFFVSNFALSLEYDRAWQIKHCLYIYSLSVKLIIWEKRIFLMTTVGVVGTTRGGERVKAQKGHFENLSSLPLQMYTVSILFSNML